MQTNEMYRTAQQETNERGRAHLRAIQARGLTELQLQLDEQDKQLPSVVSNDEVWKIRSAVKQRVGASLQKILDCIKRMADTAKPWVKRFYRDVLRKYIFTEANLNRLRKVAGTAWSGAKALVSWVVTTWQRHPGIAGAIAGAIVGAKSVAGVAGILAAIPVIGGFLAGIASTIAIAGGAILASKASTWFHDDWYRTEVLDGQTSVQSQIEQLKELVINQSAQKP